MNPEKLKQSYTSSAWEAILLFENISIGLQKNNYEFHAEALSLYMPATNKYKYEPTQ